MSRVIRLKPHHFIDIVTAFGDGLEVPPPHPYGHAVHLVTGQVLADREALLEMELGADDICAPCVHQIGGQCDDLIDTTYRPQAPSSKGAWNLIIDRRWCARLGLAQGDRLTASQFCLRMRQQAGELTDIYREMPASMTAERQRKLEAGIRKFLER